MALSGHSKYILRLMRPYGRSVVNHPLGAVALWKEAWPRIVQACEEDLKQLGSPQEMVGWYRRAELGSKNIAFYLTQSVGKRFSVWPQPSSQRSVQLLFECVAELSLGRSEEEVLASAVLADALQETSHD